MKGIIITALVLTLGAFIISITSSVIKIKKKESGGIPQILSTLILTFILCLVTTSLLGYIGKDKSGMDWCKENMNHLSNGYNAKFWMIFRYDGFPNSCCSKGAYGSYERDEGTITRFLFGKTARYREDNCEFIDGSEWGKPDYSVYEEPNKFKKVLLAFKYMEEDMLV